MEVTLLPLRMSFHLETVLNNLASTCQTVADTPDQVSPDACKTAETITSLVLLSYNCYQRLKRVTVTLWSKVQLCKAGPKS